MHTPWTLHTCQRHQIVKSRTHRGRFDKESPLDDAVFQYTWSGRIAVRWTDQHGHEHHEDAPPGHGIIFGWQEPGYRYVPEQSDYDASWVRIAGAGVQAHFKELRRRHGCVLAVDPNGEAIAAMEELIDLYNQPRPTAIGMAAYRFTMMLTAELAERRDSRLAPVELAIERLLRQPYRPWSLKSMAADCGCTREHLTRSFRQRVGTSPASWLREKRLEQAVSLLRSTEIPVTIIVRESGFSSLDTLNRLLKTRHGLCATALREQFQAADQDQTAVTS